MKTHTKLCILDNHQFIHVTFLPLRLRRVRLTLSLAAWGGGFPQDNSREPAKAKHLTFSFPLNLITLRRRAACHPPKQSPKHISTKNASNCFFDTVFFFFLTQIKWAKKYCFGHACHFRGKIRSDYDQIIIRSYEWELSWNANPVWPEIWDWTMWLVIWI